MELDANVQKVLMALLRRWKLLVIVALIGAAAGYFYTANFTTLTYTSSVEFLAYATDGNDELNSNNASSDTIRSSNTSKMNYAMRMMDTYIEIMKTTEFSKQLADDLNATYNANYTAESVRGAFVVTSVPDTAMFRVAVTTTSADFSYKIAKQLETTIPKMMKEKNQGLVRATVEDRAVLATAAGSLGYPKKMIISTAIALILAIAYIILRTLLDVRVKSSDELTEKYSIPVLGEIPNFEAKLLQTSTYAKGENK